jgi:uroporphyrin-III C-methyltransferase/precorrin-2 dehydrogenase/sirohydrochlorin ferrochelatase
MTAAAVLPLFVSLEHIPVLIIGGGRVAWRKCLALLEVGAHITLVAPVILPEFERLPALSIKRRAYCSGDLSGQSLVIIATDRPEIQQAAAEDCRKRGLLWNRVDSAEDSAFITGKVWRQAPLTVGITSSGLPTLSRLAEELISQAFPEEWFALADLLQEIRPQVKAGIADPGKRQEFFRRWSTVTILKDIAREGKDVIRSRLWQELETLAAKTPED